jgi:hypothetical protein
METKKWMTSTAYLKTMHFIHYTGYSGSGKTQVELNYRHKLGLLNSTDRFPHAQGIAFFNSVLYQQKPQKKTALNFNKIDWFGIHRINYYKLMNLLRFLSVHTFVVNSLDLLFSKKDIYQILADGHKISIFDLHVSFETCKLRYKNRCKIQNTNVLDSFERYQKLHERTLKIYNSISHQNFNIIIYKLESELICFDVLSQQTLSNYLTKDYMNKLIKWKIFD